MSTTTKNATSPQQARDYARAEADRRGWSGGERAGLLTMVDTVFRSRQAQINTETVWRIAEYGNGPDVV